MTKMKRKYVENQGEDVDENQPYDDRPMVIPQDRTHSTTSQLHAPNPPTYRRLVKAKSPQHPRDTKNKMLFSFRLLRDLMYRAHIGALNESLDDWAKARMEENDYELDMLATYYYQHHLSQIQALYKPSFGKVLMFGCGNSEQLAISNLGPPGYVLKPKLSDLLLETASAKHQDPMNIVSVVCGYSHTLALTDGGDVYGWGFNDELQLGCSPWDKETYKVLDADISNPVKITGFYPSDTENGIVEEQDEKIIAIAAGNIHNLALSITGRVYSFGTYKDGANDNFRGIPPPNDHRIHQEEKDVEMAENARVKSDTDNEHDVIKFMAPPRGKQGWPMHEWKLPGKADKIACGHRFSAAIVRTVSSQARNRGSSEDNDDDDYDDALNKTLVTWGMNDAGELARPVIPIMEESPREVQDLLMSKLLTPTPVQWFDENRLSASGYKRLVLDVACGGSHMLVIAKDTPNGESAVYSAGQNNYGQLGLGFVVTRKSSTAEDIVEFYKTLTDRLTRVTALDNKHISQISCGGNHSLCLDISGRNLFSFGAGDKGQLGITRSLPPAGYLESTPKRVSLLNNSVNPNDIIPPNPRIKRISCGESQSFAVTEENEVYSWGFGEHGSLGHGDDEDQFLPKKIEIFSDNLCCAGCPNPDLSSVQIHDISSNAEHSAIVLKLPPGSWYNMLKEETLPGDRTPKHKNK